MLISPFRLLPILLCTASITGGAQTGPLHLTISPANSSIALGSNPVQLSAAIAFVGNNTAPADVTQEVVWTSSDGNIASLTGQGLLSPVSQGTVTITAARGPFHTTTTLTVISALAVIGVAISPATPSVPKGIPQQFVATATFSDNSTQDVTAAAGWNSSSVVVAQVALGVARTVGIGSSTITASFKGFQDSTLLTVTAPILQHLVLTPQNPTVPLGLTQQFSAIGIFSDDSTQDFTAAAAWGSSNQAVATVVVGLATTRAQGGTTISATYNTFSDSTLLTVAPPALVSIAVSPNPSYVKPGTSTQLTATGFYTDNSSQDLTFSSSWYSTDPSTASVSGTGVVTGVRAGMTTVNSYAAGITGSATIFVPALLSISVSPGFMYVHTGTSLQLSATGNYSDGTTLDLTFVAIWKSSNPSVASVSGSGLVVAVVAGTTTITATYAGISGAATITVPSITSVVISPSNPTVPYGQSLQLSATANFSDGTSSDVTTSAAWKSSNAGIVSVNTTGGITGRATGLSAVVTATVGAAHASATVTVTFSNANVGGRYAFLFSGTDGNGFFIAAGSFYADGGGNISSGAEDLSDAAGASSFGFTGTYTVGPDGRGTASLSSGDTLVFVLSTTGLGTITEFDSFAVGSGDILAQDTSAFSPSAMQGSYAFLLDGADPSGYALSAVGKFAADASGGISSGLEDINDGGSLANYAFAGSYTAPDGSGRGTAYINNNGVVSSFAFYIVSRNQIIFIETDYFPALLGIADRRSSSSFSNGVLSNYYVFGGGGVTVNGADAGVGEFFANGNGTITSGVEDANDGGSVIQNTAFSGSYQTASSGRGTAALGSSLGTSNYIFYAVSPSLSLFIGSDAGEVISGNIESHAGSGYSDASLQGSYGFLFSGNATTAVAQVTANGAGTVFGAEDLNQSGTLTTDAPLSGSYSVQANGRGTATINDFAGSTHFAFYIVSGNRVRAVETDSSLVFSGFGFKLF